MTRPVCMNNEYETLTMLPHRYALNLKEKKSVISVLNREWQLSGLPLVVELGLMTTFIAVLNGEWLLSGVGSDDNVPTPSSLSLISNAIRNRRGGVGTGSYCHPIYKSSPLLLSLVGTPYLGLGYCGGDGEGGVVQLHHG